MDKDKLRILQSCLGTLTYLAFQNGYLILGAALLISNGLLVIFLGHSRLTKLTGVACLLYGLYVLLLLLGVLLHFLTACLFA